MCLFLLLRDNLVLLQVGFRSLTYEMQKQEPAYDSNSLFGKKSDFAPEYLQADIYKTPLSLPLSVSYTSYTSTKRGMTNGCSLNITVYISDY